MRVLIVKTSSLGDLVHTLPAVTDARKAIPEIVFDWVAEEDFVEIPTWHPAVDEVIPIGLRRWRRQWLKTFREREVGAFVRRLQQRRYDRVIDAQGLVFKSAWVARLACGPAAGYDRESAREPWVAGLYEQTFPVSRKLHAISRNRRLFAAALDYEFVDTEPDYGLSFDSIRKPRSLVFLQGASWVNKQWPLVYWIELLKQADSAGFAVQIPWHGDQEKLRVQQMIDQAGCGEAVSMTSLTGLARLLACCSGVVGLDSGLAHVTAALNTPAVTLYGPTRMDLTGAQGRYQHNLAVDFACAPCMKRSCTFTGESAVIPACFATLPPVQVWQALMTQLELAEDA